tara:strand:+ start:440 stop:658 length:219 start_codon:yes stop_codon:yes gene_type:complete
MAEKLIKWNYKEMITPIEFIKRIEPLISGPVCTMYECDGDMWLSDYRKLSEAHNHLRNARDDLEEKESKKVS